VDRDLHRQDGRNERLANLTNDLNQRTKDMLRSRREANNATGRGRQNLGFTIYGRKGEELWKWTTKEDDDDKEMY